MTGTRRADGPLTLDHVTAGPSALTAMAKLLGLEGGPRSWRLEGLCALGTASPVLRACLAAGGHRLVFYLLAPDAPEASVRAPGLSLRAEGGGPALQRLLKTTAARLGKMTLKDAVSLIEEDPRSFAEQVAPGQPERMQVPCIGQPITLLESGWRNFFADQDFEVLLGVPVCSSNKTVNIEYADLECYYARPRRSFDKWTFLDWPEESEDSSPGGTPHEGDANIIAELEERDMVMGTGERADALVEEVRKRAKGGKFLVFTHLCTPIIMGEDMQGLAKRCEEAVGASAVRWSQKDRDGNDNFGDHFRALLGGAGFLDGPGDEDALNLFHFPRRCRELELKPFLAKLGLTTNISVFPDVDFTVLEALPKAHWQVFCKRSSYPTKVRELLADSQRPVATVPAPYGVEGTRQCLLAIAQFTDREEKFLPAWKRLIARHAKGWLTRRQEALGYRLAFVVSEATLPRLLELRYGYGAPLAAMTAEMGFGLDLLYYDIHGENPRLPQGLAQARVTVFRTPWELERALQECRAHAVFSDITFDWRLNRAGKARFSSKDFEMGVEGALRTFDRLLALCRMPFYRRYAGYLAAAGGR